MSQMQQTAPRILHGTGLVLGQRRTLVVNSRYQRGLAGLAALLIGAGCLAFVGALYVETAAVASAIAKDPALGAALEPGLGLPSVALVGLGLVLCASVYVLVLIETRRTAGADVSLRRFVEGLTEGHYAGSPILRHGDHLVALRAALEELGQSLAQSSQADAATLQALSESLASGKDAGEIAAELSALAARIEGRTQA